MPLFSKFKILQFTKLDLIFIYGKIIDGIVKSSLHNYE